ncbi:MAG: HD-GYP domain-containing protein, partial [Lachnospira sp.]|nr:HD-GYP domain-containing protein [Lachnospira sp.]
MIRRHFMRTRQLKPGMKIDQSIVDRLGRNLVTRGSILDEYIIDSMLKMGIMTIYIQEGTIEPEDIESKISPEIKRKIEKLHTDDPAKVNLSASVRKRVSEGIQFIYNNAESDKLANATDSIASDLMKAIDSNDAIAIDINELKTSDEYTFKHSVDVATIAMILGKQQGLSKQQVYELGVSGLLHDVGKTRIPIEILNKPARLNDDEFAIMKQHSVYGYHMLEKKGEFNKEICYAVLQHHEKINGKGYPLGFNEKQITPYAKILSVADIYDALVTERPYKSAFSQRDAVEMIMSMTGELDMTAMKSFL